jgi:DNA polymerase-3 subunit alpha
VSGPFSLEADASIAEAATRRENTWVTIGGIVSAARTIAMPNGARAAVLTLTDFHASIGVLVLGKVLEHIEPQVDEVILVAGKVSKDARGTTIVAQIVERYDWGDVRPE